MSHAPDEESAPRRPCALCGDRQSPLTREHAVPQWTGERVPGAGPWTVVIGEHQDPPSQSRETPRLDVVTKAICRPCHEVPNDLEAWALPQLGGLIDGSEPLVKAGENAQRYAATWAVKTVMMCDLCLPEPLLPQQHREDFFRARAPLGNTIVWWAHYQAEVPGYRFRRRLLVVREVEDRGSQRREAFYGGLRIGHLAFFVGINLSERPLHLVRTEIDDTGLGRIWPVAEQHAAWPPGGRSLTPAGFEAHANLDLVAHTDGPAGRA